MTTPDAIQAALIRSPFAGQDIASGSGLCFPAGVRGPVFEDEVWDFTDVQNLPRQLDWSHRRLRFASIRNSAWRLVAKELMFAFLHPAHPLVAALPQAYRSPLHLGTMHSRLAALVTWFEWLTHQGVARLAEVTDEHCVDYRDVARIARSGPTGAQVKAGTLRRRLAPIVDLVHYRDLFTADRLAPTLSPWRGVSSVVAAGWKPARANTTPPMRDEVFQPLVAGALHLVEIIGPQLITLLRVIEDNQLLQRERVRCSTLSLEHRAAIDAVLNAHLAHGDPLPQMPEHRLPGRLAGGWSGNDPLLTVALSPIAQAAGLGQFHTRWLDELRPALEQVVAAVGVAPLWGRNAEVVPAADGSGPVPWTLPLTTHTAGNLRHLVTTACLVTIGALTGMRSSELMELTVGCRLPSTNPAPGLVRHRIAGTLIKGQPLGGAHEEWVVIEPVHQAVALAESLHDDPAPGAPLFGRFDFPARYTSLLAWINGPAGRRLGLAPIPNDRITPRMMRRTLALAVAYRPGGLLAAKYALKQVSIVTTEGYAARPGGAQGHLLAEIRRAERQRNAELTERAFHEFRDGRLPSGPGARSLTEFFTGVDEHPREAARIAPKVLATDRQLATLLAERADTLNIGAANYCWFADPSQALCLKLAGTPHADRPLAGLCDSARCPQATHHAVHRPVWLATVTQLTTLIDGLNPKHRNEKQRLTTELERARTVLDGIDHADQDGAG